MTQRTPLYDAHVAAGAKIVDFAGWEMPINYGSQIEEHHIVRRDAGMFDVSHMLAIDLVGCDAQTFLRRLLANDVAKLTTPGKARYSCMLKEDGGVIDDLIVYFFTTTHYRIVVNAGTAPKDLAWMREQAGNANLSLTPRRDLAMIAVQGPQARERFWTAFPASRAASEPLGIFQAAEWNGVHNGLIARTGYTGEDGFEITVPADQAAAIWQKLLDAGVKPAGLGARDTLRLEAGMNLYGQDMDETQNPLESGLTWTVDFKDANRDFTGKSALVRRQSSGALRQLLGLVLLDKGILRAHQKVVAAQGASETTSGSFAPTLNQSIAFARLPAGVKPGDEVQVEIRDKLLRARVVKPPFARNGKPLI
ncbi:MAG: glycine cleavage system aminomethyltransferase GcvT [Rhodocyclaceae bacterium]|nr:glycine cleavage system aminomethyltransferase GcvT [Rhodocyclaceae bacterium]